MDLTNLYAIATFLTAFEPGSALTGVVALVVASTCTWGARRRQVMPPLSLSQAVGAPAARARKPLRANGLNEAEDASEPT